MKVPYFELQIADIRQDTHDTKSFVLKPVSSPPISYIPGQFLTLVFPGKVTEERRSYSISSNPEFNEPLTITVKRIDNGAFSRFLFDQCNVGSSLYTIGAAGLFSLPDDLSGIKNVFLFAAGSGITPMRPLVMSLARDFPKVKTYLIYSNHDRKSTIFLDELEALQKTYSQNLHMDFLFSDAKDLRRARLGKFLVEELVAKYAGQEKMDSLFYLCGPHDYMQMISITLLREGVPSDNIRKEIFNAIKPRVIELPPDQDEHSVLVRIDGEQHTLKVQFPVSILETAKRQGILLPYSCEAGKCGTCVASCVEGKVWMSYNEVLLDKELDQGRVLTCTGFPIDGNVVLEYP